MDESARNDEPSNRLSGELPDDKPSSPKPADMEAGEIPQDEPSTMDESSRLRELQADVRNQDDLERDITREVCSLLQVASGMSNSSQADRLMNEQADERDSKRLERTRHEKAWVDSPHPMPLKISDPSDSKNEAQILRLHQRMSQPIGTSARVRLQNDIDKLESQNATLSKDLEEIQQRIDQRNEGQDIGSQQIASTGRMPNESRRDYLIRTGKITPFANISTGPDEGPLASLRDALVDAEDERDEKEALEQIKSRMGGVSHRNLIRPDFGFDEPGEVGTEVAQDRPKKKRRVQGGSRAGDPRAQEPEDIAGGPVDEGASEEQEESDYVASEPDAVEESDEDFSTEIDEDRPKKSTKKATKDDGMEDLSGLDDGNEQIYQTRLHDWISRRSAARKRGQQQNQMDENRHVREEQEWFMPHPTVPDISYDNEYRVPGDVHQYLFDYQKTGMQWLWELHQQHVGGIIGDEMGLGKTIQVIGYLAGLHYNNKFTKPALVVCPATVMKQWVNEFHRWWPPFRVSILHTSGSGMVNVRNESSREDALLTQRWNALTGGRGGLNSSQKAARKVTKRVAEEGHVLVTTYAGLQTYAPLLIPMEWGSVILDEGHKIRNPDTSITFHCKELRTPHRIILSGTPMQNNLTELWSLFDFVFPMRLGTLVNFRNQFEFPIRQGGYANASNLQVQTAAKCAETLKDAITPYLLQRFKIDVAADLPKKSEQVLFCKLTMPQLEAYRAFLGSEEMQSILNGRRRPLYGIDILRKICNHHDLLERKVTSGNANYGRASQSGKMQVAKSLLHLWKDTGHKTLLFTQHRIMLEILEKLVRSLPGFQYRRMDGSTPIKARQAMVDEFNNDPTIHVFLLTTRVGGLGVNLTGADRVIIYDPDWNPSTDVQARERAWRLGQKRDVTVYRLMTAGTIEEKIYHRQIFKQFLTNKILKDPKQRSTFQLSDLHDLFTLGEENGGATETSKLFQDAQVTYEPSSSSSNGQDENKDIVQKVAGVASMEKFHEKPEPEREASGVSETKDDDNTPGSNNNNNASENRIMEGIFSRAGVHSALEHDQIVNGKRVIRADPKIIEAEAKRVANEAAAELRRAGEMARSVPIGTPTWTGQSGVAGRPEDSNPRSQPASNIFGGSGSSNARRPAARGPSSASILANLSGRTPSTSRSQTNTPTPSATGGGGEGNQEAFSISMIRDFILAQGGAAFSQSLVSHFNRFCTTPQRTAEFKEMLKRIAVLERGGRNGRGKWVLKAEYAKR